MTTYDSAGVSQKLGDDASKVLYGAQVVKLMKTLPYTSPRHAQPLQFDSHSDAINPAYVVQVKREGNRLVRDVIAEVPPINLDEVLK